MIHHAFILAGGKGTRIHPLFPDIPKPLIPISGKPVLVHQLELLKRYAITNITLLLGHEASQIQRYFSQHPISGITLHYEIETHPYGTAGALKQAKQRATSPFLLVYGDVMINMDLARLLHFHQTNNALATLVVHPNDHPYDSDLVALSESGEITQFFSKQRDPSRYYKNCVNAGLYVLSPSILDAISGGVFQDFGTDIFPNLVRKGGVFGYDTAEYLKDMGTPERFQEISRDVDSGRFSAMHRDQKRPAFFLDRDGTLNKEVNLLSHPDQLTLLPGVSHAIRRINHSEALAIVVTNQSVIARNLVSFDQLHEIHHKLDTLLGQDRAKLDGLYYCPHHPDRGYPEENKAYKIDCTCRKPKSGMVSHAAADFNIDLSRSIMIGDSPRDIGCGLAAGIKTAWVATGHAYPENPKFHPDYRFDSLPAAVDYILDHTIL